MGAKDIEKHKFKKGETGNPNGRPKGTLNRSTIVKKWLESKASHINPLDGMEVELTQAEIITLELIKKAHSGDVNAFRELMDSAFGKIPQNTDLTTGGEPINTQFDYSNLSDKELRQLADLTKKATKKNNDE